MCEYVPPAVPDGMRCTEPDHEWFQTRGFSAEQGRWAKAWSHRSGYDFTTLIFVPWSNSRHPTRWDVLIRHHASGTNPVTNIGCCDTLREMETIYEAIRAIND